MKSIKNKITLTKTKKSINSFISNNTNKNFSFLSNIRGFIDKILLIQKEEEILPENLKSPETQINPNKSFKKQVKKLQQQDIENKSKERENTINLVKDYQNSKIEAGKLFYFLFFFQFLL